MCSPIHIIRHKNVFVDTCTKKVPKWQTLHSGPEWEWEYVFSFHFTLTLPSKFPDHVHLQHFPNVYGIYPSSWE